MMTLECLSTPQKHGGTLTIGLSTPVSEKLRASRTKPYRILLIDDTPQKRESYRRHIAQGTEQDYLFSETDAAEEGLRFYRSEPPDCVVIDYDLHGMNALEFMAELRTEQSAGPLPVVVLGRQRDEGEAERALRLGAHEYLVENQACEGLRHAVHGVMEGLWLRRQIEEQRLELGKHARALREGEELYGLILESIVDYAIFMLDPEGHIASWNAGAERINGYKADEVLGLHHSLFYLEEDIQSGLPQLGLSVAAAKGRCEEEGWQLRKDGSRFWANLIITTMYDEAGQIRGFSKVTRDISERKRAEEALVERARLAAMGADISTALTRSDALRDCLRSCAEALVRHLDAAFARVWTLNTQRDMLELQASAGIYTHIDGPHGRVPVGQYKIGLIAQERQPHLTNDVIGDPRVGDQEWAAREGMIAFAGYPLIVEDRLVGVMALFARRPLTEATLQEMASVANGIALGIQQKRALEALRESEGRFRQMAENIRDVFWMTSPDASEVLYVSPVYEDIWGRTCQSLYEEPQSWAASIPDEERERLLNDFGRRVQAGGIWESHFQIVRPDGAIRWIWARGFPIRDERGEVYRVVGIAEDVTDYEQAQEEVHALNVRLTRRLEQLGALRRIDSVINSTLDLRLTLDTLLEQTLAQLRVDAAAILLCDPDTLTLNFAAGSGFRGTGINRSNVRLGEGYVGRAALERQVVVVPNLSEVGDSFVRAPLVAGEGFVSYYAVPLIAKGQVKGVLELYHRAPLAADPEWMDFLGTLAGQAAIAVDNASLFDGLQRSHIDLTLAYDATIAGWSRAMDMRDRETEGHTQRVTEMAMRMARASGIGGIELINIRRGAMLHDIGKMGISDAILFKPGPLTQEERTTMERHTTYAYEWLSPVSFLRPALDIPYCHHEKWDGTGYPRGLKGNQIPTAASIFAVADIWDALRSDRSYRPGWPEERVREHIRSLAGTHLDPAVVKTFLELTSAGAGVKGRLHQLRLPLARAPSASRMSDGCIELEPYPQPSDRTAR
jgi:PAS domain S-box-containing protein